MCSKYFLAILILVFSVSCKKEIDETPPTIEVINPTKNTVFNTFDTIFISALLKDNRELKFASAELQDADLITVTAPVSKNLNTPEFQFNERLIIDNIHLNSGKHYLLITAKDEDNTTRNFTEIMVNGLPLITKGYLVYETVGNQVELHHYTGGSDSIIWIRQETFKDGLIDNYYQQVGFLQESDGPFFAKPLLPLYNPWELNSDQGGITFCRSQPDQVGIQIGFKDGRFAIYKGEGDLRRSFQSEQNYIPALSLLNEDKIIVWQVQQGQTQNRIEVLFLSGGVLQVSSYNPTLINMVNNNDDEIFVGGNENGNGILQRYNLLNGLFFNIHEFTGEPIVSMCQGKEGIVFISTAQGIYSYNANMFQFSQISDIEAVNLAWDYVNERLILTTKNELMVLNDFWNPIQTYQLSGEPEKLMIWYSK